MLNEAPESISMLELWQLALLRWHLVMSGTSDAEWHLVMPVGCFVTAEGQLVVPAEQSLLFVVPLVRHSMALEEYFEALEKWWQAFVWH